MEIRKRIFKYEFEIKDGYQTKSVPLGGKVVFVGKDPSGWLCAWIEVDPGAEKELRPFVVRGTGHPIEKDEEYLGTIVTGQLVWHLYELVPKEEPSEH